MGSRTSKMGVTLVAISVLIVSLLSSGPVPIIDQLDTTTTAEEIRFTTKTWHHDCSNMTAFDGVTDQSWMPWPTDIITGSMDSIDGYIYASDYGTGPASHGPFRYHTLISPFALSDFVSFEVEIEFDSTGTSPIGKVVVALYDEMNKTIMNLKVADDWAAQDDVRVPAFWHFSNGSYTYTASTWPDDSPQQPYHESLKLSQNETGIFADIPRVGIFKLIDSVDIDSTRIVTHVSVQVTTWQSNPIPEVMRVHDIRLEWDPITEWHDDCSDLATFDGYSDNSWTHTSDISITFGSISTSGSYYYCDDVGTGTGHHGPMLYHTLTNPFELDRFTELRAEIEVDSTSIDKREWVRIGLHAPDNSSIITLQVADSWSGSSYSYVTGVYKFDNKTWTETSQGHPDYTNLHPSHETYSLISNSTGIYTSFPGITNSCLLDDSQIEKSRVVKYISIQFNGYNSDALCEIMRIHDIKLTWDSSTSDDPQTTTTQPTSPTTTTTSPTAIPTNTTGWNWGDLPDPVIFLITGMAGTILVLVIVVGCIRRGQ